MMTGDIEEFQEIISAEVLVDMEKLRDLAQLGIPDAIRGVGSLARICILQAAHTYYGPIRIFGVICSV
jgi:hypothetical protein